MSLLKRLALAAVLSCLSEGAVAQEAQPAAPSRRAEPWRNAESGEKDMPAASFGERAAMPKGMGIGIEAIR